MKILIATDGSDYSRAAVQKCCEMAIKPPETKVKIVSAYRGYMPVDTFPQSIEHTKELEGAIHKKAQEYADEGVSTIQEAFPNDNIEITTQVTMGSPERIILEAAKDWDADLIVVGSHGYGFWSRALLGSVSNSVVHHAPCSVLIIHEKKAEKVFETATNIWQTS